jgi:hypothetical protein
MDRCDRTKHGKQCYRPAGHASFCVFTRVRAKRVQRVEYEKQRRYVMARAGGYCEARVEDVCSFRASHAHHLVMRSQGGNDTPGNLLAVCAECHEHIHRNPEWAYERGFLFKRTSA